MPTYQYACTACDERLEAVQSFTDAPLTACPACQGKLRKVFSAVGVVFKGSGFYKNDSRDSGKKAAAKTDGKADAPSTATTSAESSSTSSSDGSSAGSSSAGSGAGSSAPATPAKASPAPASKTA